MRSAIKRSVAAVTAAAIRDAAKLPVCSDNDRRCCRPHQTLGGERLPYRSALFQSLLAPHPWHAPAIRLPFQSRVLRGEPGAPHAQECRPKGAMLRYELDRESVANPSGQAGRPPRKRSSKLTQLRFLGEIR